MSTTDPLILTSVEWAQPMFLGIMVDIINNLYFEIDYYIRDLCYVLENDIKDPKLVKNAIMSLYEVFNNLNRLLNSAIECLHNEISPQLNLLTIDIDINNQDDPLVDDYYGITPDSDNQPA